jgi:hypothetical protein
MPAMTEEELGALAQAEISAAIEYDRSDFRDDRTRAIEYYFGEMHDVPAEEGRSSVTTRDVADTIGWVLPGLMRVFFSAGNLGQYEPRGPEDRQSAQQATDLVNYLLMHEADGYQVLGEAIHDALLHGNGIVKHWWDDTPTVKTYVLNGLDDNQAALILKESDVEVMQHSQVPAEMQQPGQPPVMLHNLKVRRTEKNGCVKIAAVPPEEFLIDSRARSIETARFTAHRSLRRRSELIEMGFDKAVVDELSAFGSLGFDDVQLARLDQDNAASPPGMDKSTDEIEVVECYLRCDADGDGVAEMLCVWMAGGSSQVLDWYECGYDVPFTDFVIERVPHRWRGRSIFDLTEDIQRVKTVLLRGMLDNLYQVNLPDRWVNEGVIKNPDALYDRRVGNVIRVDGDPNAACADKTVAFIGNHVMAGLQYLDTQIETRTGVSRSTMALDLEALQNQSATAVNAAQSAAYAKIELIARNLAEMGFKRLFKALLKLIVQYQDRPKTIRLRNKWVEIDPRAWNADMDVIVNTGLGSGSRERDLMALGQISAKQEAIIAQGGPANPIADMSKYASTLRRMVEAAGIRNPDDYFGEVTPEQAQQLAQQQQLQPDPKAQEAQARIQLEQQKAQADMQMRQQEAQADLELQRQKGEAELQLTRERMQMEFQNKREQAAFDLQHKREVAALDAQLKREEMVLEAELTAQSNAMKARAGSGPQDDNIRGRQAQ